MTDVVGMRDGGRCGCATDVVGMRHGKSRRQHVPGAKAHVEFCGLSHGGVLLWLLKSPGLKPLWVGGPLPRAKARCYSGWLLKPGLLVGMRDSIVALTVREI